MKAIWHSKSGDWPVEVTGVAGEYDGKRYFSIKGSKAAIPEEQLDYDDEAPDPYRVSSRRATAAAPVSASTAVMEQGPSFPWTALFYILIGAVILGIIGASVWVIATQWKVFTFLGVAAVSIYILGRVKGWWGD